MDIYERLYKTPEDIGVSSFIPNIFLYFRNLQYEILAELLLPKETNVTENFYLQLNKYFELTNKLAMNKFRVNLNAVEVWPRFTRTVNPRNAK